MEFSATYTTVDTHAGGEPLRIVTAGVPRIPGVTILEKRRWARDNLDHVRRALMLEPRGHADMYGCYVTEPVSEGADMGVIFMHNEGYSDMCGHGVIALATVAVQQGLVARTVPETRVGIDSPAGFIEAFVQWDGQRTGTVRFLNVPSFLYRRDVIVQTASYGEVAVDIAFGGAFYAYFSASQLGLEVQPRNTPQLVDIADEVKRAVVDSTPVRHPIVPELDSLYGVIIDGPPRFEGNDQANICVFAEREVDRSATGTGTSGRVAQLVARGVLQMGETLRNESMVGKVFEGKAVQGTTVGEFKGVVPEIAGSAYIVGFNQWVIDPRDELGEGFLVR